MKESYLKEFSKEIEIEELPSGCFLWKKTNEFGKAPLHISSPMDAIAIIDSLTLMLKIQYPEIYIDYLDNL